ncbi:MAG: DNA polymerase III subunit alpha [Candidatus Magasanikbacteria bacterium]
MDFVHLHVHSHYSLLNGLTQIKPLVKAAKERGFSSLALTDYGSLYGAIEFYEQCNKQGLKPIIGLEMYIAPRSLHDKDLEKDKDIYHLILLAENFYGYQNLLKISSIGHLEGFFNGKPRVDKKILKEYSKNIIALSGPIEGEIPQLIKQNRIEEAKNLACEFETIFGKNNFYLELQDHPAIEGQLDVNTKLIQLSKETGIPLVVTRDVHYLSQDESEAQDVVRCISEGWKVPERNREDRRHIDRSLNTAKDIASRFRHVPEALENTVHIADRVGIEITLNKWNFASIELPEHKTADDVLRDMAFEKIEHFYNPVTQEVKDRVEYELDIIKTKGYSPYFLCVSDYVHYAKSHGIVQTTRGSAAGSLVSYVIGITTVDPIRFKLPFERFLNPHRPSPPDIDTDFADDRRDDMIAYVTGKYGADKVAQIITFGTMAARASARDVGRALGLSYSFCDQVAKLIPMGSQGFPMTIERALIEEPDLKKLYESNPDVKRLLDLAQKVEGNARHTSIHAAGVVIAPRPLTDFTPIQRETGGEKVITQYEMHAVEAAGLLKMDFLGIRNLSILGKAVEIVEKTLGEHVDVYTLPLDDTSTFEMLARGETMGTFQLGGSGMTRWLKELKPTTIDDIMAMVALYRPGPMESIPEYIRRKHNPEVIDYLDPRMKKYLEASFGLLVYQDDVILTAIELAGYDWTEADKFRKAIGKKIPEEMEKQKIKFYQGCRDHGNLPQQKIDELWRLIEPFAAYGFNKAHAASYGTVAYQTAYMKAHYPVQYMTAVLQAEAGDAEKVAAIVHECHRMNIEVLPPDVNESFRNFAMVSKPGEPGRIRFGLSAIKNLGEHISEVIYREKREHGPYTSLEDLSERIDDKDLNKKSLESLIQAGAMDCFGYDRGLLLNNIENLLSFVRQVREKRVTNQNSLFAGTEIALDNKVLLKPGPNATMDEKLVWEKNLLGLYVSSHPFAYYETVLRGRITPLSEMEEFPRDSTLTVGGVIDSLKKKITKKGDIMMFATMQDQTGSIELLVFPRTYEESKHVWKEGNVICVWGKTPKEEGDNKIFVEKAYEINKQNISEIAKFFSINQNGKNVKPESSKRVIISLSQEELKTHADDLKKIFGAHPGEYALYIKVGGRVIRTQSQVLWSEKFNYSLHDIIPSCLIEVRN